MEESTTAKKIGKIVKLALTIALFVFIGALIFRMCQASHQALKDTVITDAFKTAYSNDKDVRTHAINKEFSENGGVYAYSLVYMEKAGYLQFTVRYNTRHMDEVKAGYPDFSVENIRYVLIDGNGKEYTPHVIATEDKYNYRYFRMEFEGVNFSTNNLSVAMRFEGIDINMGTKSTLEVHKKDSTSVSYNLSSEEKKQLS